MKKSLIILLAALCLSGCVRDPRKAAVGAVWKSFSGSLVRGDEAETRALAPFLSELAPADAFAAEETLRTDIAASRGFSIEIIDDDNALVRLDNPGRTAIPVVRQPDGSRIVSDSITRMTVIDFIPAATPSGN